MFKTITISIDHNLKHLTLMVKQIVERIIVNNFKFYKYTLFLIFELFYEKIKENLLTSLIIFFLENLDFLLIITIHI